MKRLKSGLKMAKSRSLRDKKAYEVVAHELKRFNSLIEGHIKLLKAMGGL